MNTYEFTVRSLDFYYGSKKALSNISMDIAPRQVTALIGPSGCGKSTLRCLNRMNDTIAGSRVEGEILLDGRNIYAEDMDVVDLRQRVGMVFQKPNPFPQSIYENVAFGPRVSGTASHKADLDATVELSLKAAALWDDVKDRLHDNALGLGARPAAALVHRTRHRRKTGSDAA